ncbi:MAG: hypothetical protein F4W95_10510 [Chloroflexi bacterium]|nr:hypothetical protein [Chloroflexota bacterium]MYD48904.1 hypothetical protein [Chloroflexota bacterium]
MNRIIAARLFFVAILWAAALAAFAQDVSYGEKAPVLTFIGGAIVVVWFMPVRRPEWRDAVVVIGTGVATAGSWYWLMDASDGDWTTLVAALMGGVVLVIIIFVIGIVIWVFARLDGEPIERDRRAIERRLRRRLHEVVDETQHAGPRGPDGVLYERFDHVIFELFLNTWSMVKDPSRWTYAPREHKNLIDNYVVARLRRTAEIAIGKHPHQCKYGAVAYNLSDYAELYLYRVMLITEFDPLPAECPHCKEPKPTHKANCMAAICWQCKYPTPPRNQNSQITEVITPQCHIPALCFLRGESVTPKEPNAIRIKLPFTIPQDGEDQSLTMGNWPRNRRDLRNLLEILHHD